MLNASNICSEICGDGIKFSADPWCDDGNVRDGDGCSSVCHVEDEFICVNGSATSKDVCFQVYPPSAILSFPNNVATNATIAFSEEIVNFEKLNLSSIELWITGDVGQYNYSMSLSLNQSLILIFFFLYFFFY